MSTTYDVAKRAGVDQSSVSKILSGATDFRQETIDRVKAACDKLGYVPNATARQLRSQKTHTIAINIPHQCEVIRADPFIPEFLAAVSQQANIAGYSIVLSYDDGNTLPEIVLAHRADGVIITTPKNDDLRIAELVRKKIPFVTGRNLAHLSGSAACVDVDNYDAGCQAGECLIGQGHTRIASLCQEDSLVGLDFAAGIRAAMKNHKIIPVDKLFLNIDISARSAVEAARKLLAVPTPPTAIISNIALATFGLLKATASKNCSVLAPESPLLRQLYPTQQCIKVPTAELGSLMTRTLIKILDNQNFPGEQFLNVEISPPAKAAGKQ